eukprot:TRINITY_DN1108_c0_g1_i11.p1 TRINITY_DN1108_c0_g1~~TRINITY_DN1108_c0_g1_i11.p1  ORF type:complete len:126 (-),score=0.62 TRINITY_DN1108_c0_g1_i11:29-406(-)
MQSLICLCLPKVTKAFHLPDDPIALTRLSTYPPTQLHSQSCPPTHQSYRTQQPSPRRHCHWSVVEGGCRVGCAAKGGPQRLKRRLLGEYPTVRSDPLSGSVSEVRNCTDSLWRATTTEPEYTAEH